MVNWNKWWIILYIYIYKGEGIQLVQEDYDDYNDYKAPDTSRVGETSFMEGPDIKEATLTPSFRLGQEVNLNKLTGLYKLLCIQLGKKKLLGIQIVQEDYADYNDYKSPDTSRVDETSFMEWPDIKEATLTPSFRLGQEVNLNKLTGLYKLLHVKGDPSLAD